MTQQFHSNVYIQERKNINSHKNLHIDVHSRIIQNNQKKKEKQLIWTSMLIHTLLFEQSYIVNILLTKKILEVSIFSE